MTTEQYIQLHAADALSLIVGESKAPALSDARSRQITDMIRHSLCVFILRDATEEQLQDLVERYAPPDIAAQRIAEALH